MQSLTDLFRRIQWSRSDIRDQYWLMEALEELFWRLWLVFVAFATIMAAKELLEHLWRWVH